MALTGETRGRLSKRGKHSKQDIINAAVDVIRRDGPNSITAKKLAAELEMSTYPLFNEFKTIDEIREAAHEQALTIYRSYQDRALSTNLPLKAFAMEYVRFAEEEPNLFRILFMNPTDSAIMDEYLLTAEYARDLMECFVNRYGVDRDNAVFVYRNLAMYVHGIAVMCACGVTHLSQKELAYKLGEVFRGLIAVLHMPKDIRSDLIPDENSEDNGYLADYRRAKDEGKLPEELHEMDELLKSKLRFED